MISLLLFQREPASDSDSRSTFRQSTLIRRLLCSTADAACGYFGLQTSTSLKTSVDETEAADEDELNLSWVEANGKGSSSSEAKALKELMLMC